MRYNDELRQIKAEIEEMEEGNRLLGMMVGVGIEAVMTTLTGLRADVASILALLQPSPHPAVDLRVDIGGTMSDITLSVDVTGEVFNVTLLDDKGDVTTTTPNGPDGGPTSVGRQSSDPTVTTVDSATGSLTFNKAGEVDLSATLVDAAGAQLSGFPVRSVHLTLTPGVASDLQVSVDGAPPVPAPGT